MNDILESFETHNNDFNQAFYKPSFYLQERKKNYEVYKIDWNEYPYS